MKEKNKIIKRKFRKKVIACGLAIMMASNILSVGTLNKPIQVSAEVIDLGGNTYQQTVNGITYKYSLRYYQYAYIADLRILNSAELSGEIIIADQLGNDTIGYARVTTIPDYAFEGNTEIKKIFYPSTVSVIGEKAFSGCTKLESITKIGKDVVRGELNLDEIVSINSSAFEKCSKIEKVKLRGTVNIASNCFNTCSDLKSIEFTESGSESLYINENAFSNCSNLSEIVFPTYKEEIQRNICISKEAFKRCSSLKELNFSCPTKIENNGFEGCNNLEKVIFHKSVEVGDEAFLNSFLDFKNGKEKQVIFENNAEIGTSAFADCNGLTNVEFYGENTIGQMAFKGIPIRNLIFYKKTDMGINSFMDCTKLEEVTFEDNISRAISYPGSEPFYGCTSLKKMEFRGENVDAYISYLSNLESLIFGQNVTDIKGFINQLPALKEVVFWNPNVKIKLVDTSENAMFNIYGMKGSNGLSPAQVWANSNGKVSNYKSVVSNLTVNYKGKVIAGAKSEDIDLDNLEVYAYYYNEPLKAVRLEQASSKEDTSGYTITLQDTIVEGANPYYITYGQEKYYGSIEGIKKAVSKIEVSTKDDKELILVEGQTISKDKLSVIAEYNDGTTETVTDFSIEAYTIKEGKNSIQIFYGGQTGTLEVTGIKREAVAIQAVYTGEQPLEDTKLNLRYVDVTLQYNDGSEESITNYNFPEFNLDQDTLTLGDNTITVRAKNLETTIKITTIRKSLESISASYNNTEVVEANEVLPKNITVMAHYNNGTREELKNYELDPYVIQVGSNTITIRYEGKMTTITVNGIKRSLQAIEAVYSGDTLKAGTVLEKDSIYLTGTYNDSTKEEIKDKATLVLENDTLHAGENTIVLSYGGLQTTLKLIVTEEVEATATPENTTVPPVSTPTSGVITASPAPSSTPTETTASPTPSVAPDNNSSSPQPTQTAEPVVTKEPNATNTPDNSKQNIGALTLKTNIKNLGINQSKTDTYNIITNKTIQFTLQTKNIQRISYQFVAKKSTLKESAWKTVKNNQVEIKSTSKPSVLYLRYVDKNGTTTIVKTKGFLIDKTAPTICGIANKKTYKKAVTITFKDALSGVKTALLNKKPVKSGVKVSKKGSYTLLVTDKAGNQKKVVFKIKK